MPRIFDHIERSLLPVLRETLAVATRAAIGVQSVKRPGWRILAMREGAPQ